MNLRNLGKYLQVMKTLLEHFEHMIKKTLCTKRNKLTMTEHGTKDCFWACVMIDPWLNGPITGSDK